MVAPSANPSNRVSPTKAIHVYDYFKETIDFIKCRIANCNSYIRNAVKYIIINNNIKNIKITNPIDIKNMFIKLGIIYS